MDDHRVLVLNRRTGRMKHSGNERPSVGAQLFSIRGGRVIGLISCSERERPYAFTRIVRYAFDLT